MSLSKLEKTKIEKLRATLSTVRRRRRLLSMLHQTSLMLIGVAVLVLTLSVVSLWLPPSPALQTLLFLCFGAIAAVLVWRYVTALRRLRADDRQLARFVESRMPDLEQRLLTSLEFSSDEKSAADAGVSAQFVRQLWNDADLHLEAQQQQLAQVSDVRLPLMSLATAGAVALVTLIAFVSSEALLRAGGQILWPFGGGDAIVVQPIEEALQPPAEMNIVVVPGDIRMQRGRDATIVVRIENASPDDVSLRMQTDQLNWFDVSMRRDGSGSDGAAFSYYMPAVEEDTEYYVSVEHDGEQRSRQYRISLYDLPRAEQIDVAYAFPGYTGLEDYSEEDAGDMVVPEGTQVTLSMAFNKAVQQAQVVFDDDTSQPVSIDGLNGTASFTVAADSTYRIVATDYDSLQTEDPEVFYIRAIEDQPPELVLHSPGRDQDVMPLEEVILEVEASDDYGLSEFILHYSVVGREEVAVDFLPAEQTRSIAGNQMIYMEDLSVLPGDFISYYMTLADNNDLSGAQSVVSDIYFLQVVPTDQEFRRASGGGQQGGGGGGGGGDSSALVTLQKDIISATWRLRQNQMDLEPRQFADDVAVIAESQRDAVQRATMSIDRLSERIDFADDTYANAVTFLQRAIEQMELAATELDEAALTSAMVPEQQALQLVLRAEAEINRTDVNFQRTAGGGGGGGAQQEREDLQELFDMEMGQNENRYETPRQASSGQGNSEEASRLEELAQRQESLTRAQRNLSRRMDDMTEEQRRRELERLRREQEQLSNELAQLDQRMSRGQQQAQGQPGQQGQQGQAGAQQESRMQRALQQMQEAAQADTPAQAAARSQRALESLREQQRQMEQQPGNSANQLAQNLSQRGQQLIEQQRQLQQALSQLSREQGVGQSRDALAGNEDVQSLLNQQQQNRQALEELERMLRAVIARAGNDEQQLLSQAQQASRAVRPLREQMDTSNRVLRNGMVNLAVDIEQEIADALGEFGQNLQALNPGSQPSGETGTDALMQAAADASALREQLESLQQEIEARAAGGQGEESISQLRERLSRSQSLAQQLTQQLDNARQDGGQPGEQGSAQRGQQASQQAGQAQGGQPGQQPGNGGQRAGGGQLAADQTGLGGAIPAPGEAALWGNARSISSDITQQSLEAFMSQPALLQGLLQPLVELESDLRARAELAQITRRLYAVSEEDIPDQYRRLVEAYYRALSENRSAVEPVE
ncbi:MAG: hypothetical protein CMQ34_12655 [Gammaproteobacteria bacterium]|nr:hypothetical protein [Gammaproteobacteria bacterium]